MPIERTTSLTADFQDLITRYAWGEIWTRPGLDRRQRSCITLTALVALDQLEELEMHVRAALRNDLTVDGIKEVLLHSAIYRRVPAANAAFAVAKAPSPSTTSIKGSGKINENDSTPFHGSRVLSPASSEVGPTIRSYKAPEAHRGGRGGRRTDETRREAEGHEAPEHRRPGAIDACEGVGGATGPADASLTS